MKLFNTSSSIPVIGSHELTVVNNLINSLTLPKSQKSRKRYQNDMLTCYSILDPCHQRQVDARRPEVVGIETSVLYFNLSTQLRRMYLQFRSA